MAQHTSLPQVVATLNTSRTPATLTLARMDGAILGRSDHGCPVTTLALPYDVALALADALVNVFPPGRDETQGAGTGSAKTRPVDYLAQIEQDMIALNQDARPHAPLRLAAYVRHTPPTLAPRPTYEDFNDLPHEDQQRLSAAIRAETRASDDAAITGQSGPPLVAPYFDPLPANVAPGHPHTGMAVVYVLTDGQHERIAFVTAVDAETGRVDLVVLLAAREGNGTMEATSVPYCRHMAGMTKRPHSWHLTGEE